MEQQTSGNKRVQQFFNGKLQDFTLNFFTLTLEYFLTFTGFHTIARQASITL